MINNASLHNQHNQLILITMKMLICRENIFSGNPDPNLLLGTCWNFFMSNHLCVICSQKLAFHTSNNSWRWEGATNQILLYQPIAYSRFAMDTDRWGSKFAYSQMTEKLSLTLHGTYNACGSCLPYETRKSCSLPQQTNSDFKISLQMSHKHISVICDLHWLNSLPFWDIATLMVNISKFIMHSVDVPIAKLQNNKKKTKCCLTHLKGNWIQLTNVSVLAAKLIDYLSFMLEHILAVTMFSVWWWQWVRILVQTIVCISRWTTFKFTGVDNGHCCILCFHCSRVGVAEFHTAVYTTEYCITIFQLQCLATNNNYCLLSRNG